MESFDYLDFELAIRPDGDAFVSYVLASPAGEAKHPFRLPFSEEQLEGLILRLGQNRSSTSSVGAEELQAARELGGALFSAVFSGEVLSVLRGSLNAVKSKEGTGLRIKLRLQDAPVLADIPWEFLHDPQLDRFLAQSNRTPIIRYVEIPEIIRPLSVTPPLRILAMVSSPKNARRLDTDRERSLLAGALAPLQERGLVEIEWQEDATMQRLQRSLRPDRNFHVFHFIGHGLYSEGEGGLVMEDEGEEALVVGAHTIATMLGDHPSLRLAVFNSCEGARNSRVDPFSGVASTVIRQGVPAAVAMQFEITDSAAITFASELYSALAVGMPVDAAVAESRKAVYGQNNDIEWGTPVLYMRAPDGVLFVVEPVAREGAASPTASEIPAEDGDTGPAAESPPSSSAAPQAPSAPEVAPWTWAQAVMALLLFLNLGALAVYFWNVPEVHFSYLGKVLSTLGGWLLALVGVFGLKLRAAKEVPLRDVLVMRPLVLCVLTSTLIFGYLVPPIHAVTLTVVDAEKDEPLTGVRVRVDSEKEPRARVSSQSGQVRIRGLSVTAHTFELSKSGFEPRAVSTSFMDALPFGSPPGQIQLEPVRVKLKIESEPTGADVFLDGKEDEPEGRTPTSLDLRVGSHSIRVAKQGFLDDGWQKIQVAVPEKPDSVPSHRVKLRRPPPGEAAPAAMESTVIYTITIKSSPSGAEILLNGTSRGTTPDNLQLREGAYQLELRKVGYEVVTRRLLVPGDQVNVTLKPETAGSR